MQDLLESKEEMFRRHVDAEMTVETDVTANRIDLTVNGNGCLSFPSHPVACTDLKVMKTIIFGAQGGTRLEIVI